MSANKQMNTLLVAIGIVILVIVGYGGYQLGQRQVQPSATAPTEKLTEKPVEKPAEKPVENSAENNMVLNFGTRLTVPKGWTITLREYGLDSQMAQYEVNTGKTTFALHEIKASVWVKGPWLENQGLSPTEDRPALLTAMKQVYENQAISPAFTNIFDKQAGDFFGYSQNNRVARQYVASVNNQFRGLSFFNLNGQSPILSPIYYVAVYNAEADVILAAHHGIEESAPEIATVNAQITKGMQTSDPVVAQLDKQARVDFTKLVTVQSRAELSFGQALNDVDGLIKSAH